MTMRKKRKFKSIISTFLCLALLGGAVFGVTKLLKTDSDTVEIKNSAFAVGALDEEGKYVENKQTLYTKEMFRCDGLTVELDKECTATYQIFFYNYFGEFLASTDVLSEDFDEEILLGCVYAKVMVIPEIPEGEKIADFKISFFEKAKYLDGITITVDYEQNDGNIVSEIKTGKTLSCVENELVYSDSEDHACFEFDMNNSGYDYFILNNGKNDITVVYRRETTGNMFSETLLPGEIFTFHRDDPYDILAISWNINDPTPIMYMPLLDKI